MSSQLENTSIIYTFQKLFDTIVYTIRTSGQTFYRIFASILGIAVPSTYGRRACIGYATMFE